MNDDTAPSRWRMPAEGDPHERTWMAWPHGGYTLGETAADAAEARGCWASVANAVAGFEPVAMIVDPSDIGLARRHLDASIELYEMPIDDAWVRDSGPTFVLDGSGALGAVDWVFNGWGAQAWARWENDELVARQIAALAGAEQVPSSLVNEGGGIHVDGRGTVLVTETVQRDPGRNPDLDRADIERELVRTIGAGTAVWLPRGLTRDSEQFGTRGHVDIVATIASPGRVLVHDQRDPAHPDADVTHQIVEVLQESVDAAGDEFEIVRIPAPTVLRDREGFVDYSYINHLLVNGGVVACAFGDPNDQRAAALLGDAYAGRDVVAVDARPLFARGGGIHCITQQQPRRG